MIGCCSGDDGFVYDFENTALAGGILARQDFA